MYPLSRFRNGGGFGSEMGPSSGSGWRDRCYCSRCVMDCQLMIYNRFGFISCGGLELHVYPAVVVVGVARNRFPTAVFADGL